MRPFKIRTISGQLKKVKITGRSDIIPEVGVRSERYIDFTDFQEGYVMTYDADLNRYHFVNSDEILKDTYKQESPPETFSQEIYDELFDGFVDEFDIDMGEY